MADVNRAATTIRERREALGISQARLSEVSGVKQYALSAFELGKRDLPPDDVDRLTKVLASPEHYGDVISRRKRYRTATYRRYKSGLPRSNQCFPSPGNAEYVETVHADADSYQHECIGLSLFAGCGGFSKGFSSAGYRIAGFVEIDEKLSNIYSANFPSAKRIGGDISQVENRDIETFLREEGDVDIIIGGPPCQGFSLAGKRRIDDPRNYLFQEYIRFLDVVRPKVALMENVRLLASMRSKHGGLVKHEILSSLEAHGYRSKMFSINAVDYGVPQHRERVVFIAVRSDLGNEPTLPPIEYGVSDMMSGPLLPYRTFSDACSDLPYIESGGTSEDIFHVAVAHPDHVIEWLWDVPQGASAHENADPNMRPPSGYNTTYKRQVWDAPASTVQTTFGMISGCRNVHPIATRSLTVREAARIQSFPDDFRFIGPLGTIRTGIGNAVPPLLARKIAQHIRSMLLDVVEVPSR